VRADDEKAATHLSRLGVNPVVIQRLAAWAELDGESLRETVRYILSAYEPPHDVYDETQDVTPA
jgi:hypothetical protein